MKKALALLSLCAALQANGADVSSAAVDELAPSGTMRVGVAYGSPVLVNRGTGQLRGVAVDIAHELQRQTGLRLEFVRYDRMPRLLAELQSDTCCDIAFVSLEVARAARMASTPSYMEIDLTYLVPARSRFQSVADIDSPGVRVVVQQHNTTDLFLSTRLMQAVIFRVSDEPGALRLLKAGAAEAYASNREQLLTAAESDSGYRVLADRFSTFSHVVAVPSRRLAAAAYLRAFMEELKASGFVERAIRQAHVRGAAVASPAN
jgi:polar amino acid transport system substrate-binding protein